MSKEIREIILEGFNSWNTGLDAWKNWVDQAYKNDAFSMNGNRQNKTVSEYKTEIEADSDKNVKRLYFDNILINNNWSTINYRFNSVEGTTKDARDRIQFLRFEETDEGLKIAETWRK